MMVKLTWPEVKQAAFVGVLRQARSLRRGDKNRYGCGPEDGWSKHIEGACAELAFAKAFGFYWADKGDDRYSGDVAGFEVRGTDREDGCLILHKPDTSTRVFVLVVGRAPDFRLAGWIRAAEGKQDRWWCDPSRKGRPAYFVPQAALEPMAEFMIAAWQ